MTKTVPKSEASQRLSELLDWVAQGDEVVLEDQGKPAFVILRASDLDALRDAQQRWEAFELLEAVRARVRARNQDLTDEQADELADRAAHDAVDSLAERGVLRFERDRKA
jgi:prevent-host-death family protein